MEGAAEHVVDGVWRGGVGGGNVGDVVSHGLGPWMRAESAANLSWTRWHSPACRSLRERGVSVGQATFPC